MWNKLSIFWCKHMHTQAMWPIHGRYVCPKCFREYRVAWESSGKIPAVPEAILTQSQTATPPDNFVTM